MTESAEHRIESAQVRRSPRYAMFFLVGGVLGVLVALVLTFGFNGTLDVSPTTQAQYSTGQVFGFLCLFCIPVGVAVLGAVALLIDRGFSRRVRDVRVDHERIVIDDDHERGA
ncbi:potassium transporter Trk [Microbacterium dextranolyticum]|uniref:Potassium transporter Trk n=1 Tax=Microbacterium dextranolyticum TaxID=36806 RepID=A0A9W6M616_9MICO|nr:potassium transporter Trk [Microbacterium dextranolyticum]MBM7464360.1 hypothetical protein [Microbacterium dextranolyticum]GLJ95357.1 hypothetical protein GCM10017591_14190 [Microbacterium dextranolyticum]